VKGDFMIKTILNAIDSVILNILKFLTIAIFFVITLIMAANVFVRFVPLFSLHWMDEVIELLFAALVFYGSAALWITKGHFSAGDWISKLIKNKRIKNLYRLILELMVLGFLALFLYYSFNLFMQAHDITNALSMPKKVLYSCLPISGVIMVYYALKNVIVELIGVIKPEAVDDLIERKIS
jgi:TRAP-type transport system small permease protein